MPALWLAHWGLRQGVNGWHTGLLYSSLVSIPIYTRARCIFIYTQGETGGELTASLVCRAYRKQCSMFLPVGNMEHCIHSISSE